MAFTVGQLKEALEVNEVPDDAVVFIEFGNYVRAASKMALVHTEEFEVLAIQTREEETVN
jgi:hypothetical protein